MKRRCHSIGRLLKDEAVQLSDVVLDTWLNIEPNPAHLLDQVLPVGFHGPPPTVAICSWIINVPDIVHQHTPEEHADRLLGEAKRLRPFVPKLKLHSDPMLIFRQAPFCRLVINANQDSALFTAMVDRDSRPTVIKLLLYFGFAKFADKLLLPILVVRIPEKPLDVQNAGMIIKGHVKPGHMKAAVSLEQMEKPVKITCPVFLEATASLAGHVQTAPHSRVAVVQDGNASEVNAVPVSVPAMTQVIPAAALHPKQLYPALRVLVLAAHGQPIIENDIL